VNLAGKPELKDVQARLVQELFRWMYDTGDFLRAADQAEQVHDMDRELRQLAL
jgi:hypothetical protein